jgi:hypothetical protein
MSTDTSSLVSAASGLASDLGGLLSTAAAPLQAASQLAQSGVSSIAQNLQSALPTVSVSSSGVAVDTQALSGIPNITGTATATAQSVQTALDPALQGSAAQFKKAAAKVDVSKLKATGDDYANSLPAAKAKEWRQKGKEKDSQGRPGALFYQAGKFAIQNLNADVSTESLP